MSAPLNLTIKNNINDMEIGDCIPCRYTSTASGNVGYFSELGTCNTTEIPITSSATPNGLFYFIKAAKGLLIADRVVQHSISWDTLNNNKFIEGAKSCSQPTDYIDTDAFATAGWSTGNSIYSKIAKNNVSCKSNTESVQMQQNWDFLSYNTGVLICKFKVKNIDPDLWFQIYNMYAPTTQMSCINISSTYIQLPNIKIIYTGDVTNKEIIYFSDILNKRIGVSIDGNIIYANNNYITPTVSWATISEAMTLITTKSSTYKNVELSYLYMSKTTGNYFLKDFNHMIRSLSGGCAYSDSTGNKSLTDCGKGVWPINNEWDKYIVNSTLNNKIISGDDNIWHIDWGNKSLPVSWIKETGLSDIIYNNNNNIGSSSSRLYRPRTTLAHIGALSSNFIYSSVGFRPVLEYIESNSKQTNLFY